MPRKKRVKISTDKTSTEKEASTPPASDTTDSRQAEPFINENENRTIARMEMINARMLEPSDAGSSAQEEDDESVCTKKRGKEGKRRHVFLTDEQKDDVIEFLMRNEGLYDKKKELWCQPNKKNELWQQQGIAMGIEWKVIYTLYETQRRRLGRLKNLAHKSGSGSLEDTWKEADIEFWQRWQFLRPHINNQYQEPIVSLRGRIANAPASTFNRDDGPTEVVPDAETEADDLSENCNRPKTPEDTRSKSTPASTTTQGGRRSSHDVNQIMDALVSSSERHHQLINLSESLLRSQQVPADQHRDRYQFNLWCGSLLQQLPQALYQQCEADIFRLMTNYRNLAQCHKDGEATAAPTSSRATSQQMQQQQPHGYNNQAGWQPHPSTWIPNPQAASSVWASQGCGYMNQYNQQQQQHQFLVIAPFPAVVQQLAE